MPDWDFGNQQRHIAQVIDVVMGNHEVVDLFQAGRLDGFYNPVDVPAVGTGPSRIEQHRLPGWRHAENGLTSFDVDDIDIEWPGRGSHRHEQEKPKKRGCDS